MDKNTNKDKHEQPQYREEVCVLICNKNNAGGLKKLVPSLLKQNYSPFRVVVIDDQSTDDSLPFLEKIKDNRLRVIMNSEDHAPGKKFLLKKYIQTIISPWVLLTDADCLPADDTWITHMLEKAMIGQYEVVLGYSPYFRHPGWLNALIRYEGLWVAWQYFLAAQTGWAYGGVGRNLLVRRPVFDHVQWHEDLASGDDDFLVQAADMSAVGLQINPSAFVYSEGPSSLAAWINRKARHTTTAYRFPWQVNLRLGVWHIFLWYWWIAVLLFACVGWPLLASGILFIKFLGTVLIIRPWSIKFEQSDLWCISPFLEIFISLVYLVVLPLSYWGDRRRW